MEYDGVVFFGKKNGWMFSWPCPDVAWPRELKHSTNCLWVQISSEWARFHLVDGFWWWKWLDFAGLMKVKAKVVVKVSKLLWWSVLMDQKKLGNPHQQNLEGGFQGKSTNMTLPAERWDQTKYEMIQKATRGTTPSSCRPESQFNRLVTSINQYNPWFKRLSLLPASPGFCGEPSSFFSASSAQASGL